ncbi:MAG: SgcJ/EcaC family oxidoreductase [Candidatus Acidiferrales bacterium]
MGLHTGLIFLLLVLGGRAAPSAQDASADRTAIQGVIASFVDAWNKHDAHAFSMVFATDADFTNVIGMSASGREAIEKIHAPLFQAGFKDSHQTADDIKIRFLKPDVAAVDVRWEMTGAVRDGKPIPLRKGLLNFSMVKENGAWLIKVMHNMDLSAETR